MFSYKLSLSGAQFSRPKQNFVGHFSVSLLGGLSTGASSCGSTSEGIRISVVVHPCGIVLSELFVELLLSACSVAEVCQASKVFLIRKEALSMTLELSKSMRWSNDHACFAMFEPLAQILTFLICSFLLRL